jgi:hypothetical protein
MRASSQRVGSGSGPAQRGLASLEMAVWCVVLLPIVFLGFALYGFSHDMNVVQMVPESIMREATGKLITWRPDGAQGFFEVDQPRLERTITHLADRALAEIQRETEKVVNQSARACYWVLQVNTTTGQVSSLPVMSGCVDRGTPGAQFNLERLRQQRMRQGIAKPVLTETGETQGFIPQAVLLGVAVGGQFTGLGEALNLRDIQHGTVWVPREDVYL